MQQAGYLSSPNLVQKAWRILGELLVFNLCWKQGEIGSKSSSSNRIDELANKSEGKQAKEVPYFCILLSRLPPEGATHI